MHWEATRLPKGCCSAISCWPAAGLLLACHCPTITCAIGRAEQPGKTASQLDLTCGKKLPWRKQCSERLQLAVTTAENKLEDKDEGEEGAWNPPETPKTLSWNGSEIPITSKDTSGPPSGISKRHLRALSWNRCLPWPFQWMNYCRNQWFLNDCQRS